MARILPEYRGIKVKPYMRYMSYYLFSFLLVLCLIPIIFYVYFNQDLLRMMDTMTLIIIGSSIIFFVLVFDLVFTRSNTGI